MGAPWRVNEGSTAVYTATLKDEADTVIPLAAMTTLVLTLYNKEKQGLLDTSGVQVDNIINSRNALDVLNDNNVTYHATSGLLTWTMQKEDNTIVDDTLDSELHTALFTFTWSSGTKDGAHQVEIRVKNLQRNV